MARPGIINSTRAVETSIHAVVPVSIGGVSPAKENPGTANIAKNIQKQTALSLLILLFFLLLHFCELLRVLLSKNALNR